MSETLVRLRYFVVVCLISSYYLVCGYIIYTIYINEYHKSLLDRSWTTDEISRKRSEEDRDGAINYTDHF